MKLNKSEILKEKLIFKWNCFQAAKQWRQNALEENRHNIQSNLAAIDAATATVITQTSG